MNNKGFAISSVLYLLLVTFLMFLMLSMAQFSGATSVIAHANDDLTDGQLLSAKQICVTNNGITDKQVVQIKNTTGKILYFPYDFSGCSIDSGCNVTNYKVTVRYTASNKKLIVSMPGANDATITINTNPTCDNR